MHLFIQNPPLELLEYHSLIQNSLKAFFKYPQIPLDIIDVETTGYVLRLCPFETLSFAGK